jgi:hypothetical protein
VQVALLGRGGVAAASRSALDLTHPRRDGGEDRVEALDRPVRAADHQAVAALEAEDPSAGSAVDVVDAALGELARAADVVGVVGVAAIDDRVTLGERVGDLVHGGLGDVTGRNHHPDRSGGVHLRGQLLQRGRSDSALPLQRLHRVGVDVVHEALVSVAHQAADDVGPHPPQADHSKLSHPHISLSSRRSRSLAS